MDDSTLILIQIKPKQIDIYKQENKLTNLMIINLAKIRFGGTGGGNSPAKPEDFFQETYTANGNYDVAPQAGHVFSGGSITVNVQPRLQTKEATPLTLAQTVSPDAGYDGLQSVTVTGVTSEIDSNITADNIKKDVTILGVTGTLESGITPTGTININANGTYDVTDKATAVVAVGGTDYRYKNGTPDTIGLAAIGWTADDIGYYGANTPHYAWENDKYKVSQKNIDLYNLDDPQPDLYKNDPEVTFVPNKNILKYFGPGSGNTGFRGMPYIKSIPLFNTSAITSLAYWFKDCTSLQTIPLLDTSSVKDMSYMFQDCSSLASIPALNTSSCTDMSQMFYKCTSLQTIPLLNTSSCTDMSYMFKDCTSLQTIPQLDTSGVTDMSNMFSGCTSLESIPLLDTSKVIGTNSLFRDCPRLKSVEFDQSSLAKNSSGTVGYYSMFNGCSSLERVKFTGSAPTTGGNHVQYMFYGCNKLQSVEGVDFSNVPGNLNYLFGFISKLSSLTRFIVIGKINASSTDDYGFYATPNLDYESIKSILEAMNRTDNTNSKTMKFNRVIVDRDGELAGLVSSCATKGWTIQGLTVKEQSMINSITPNIDHIHMSDIVNPGVTLTVNANEAWVGGGRPDAHNTDNVFYDYVDYYNAATGELTRTSHSNSQIVYSPGSGSAGETVVNVPVELISRRYIEPKSGEYALVGITLKSASAPYEFVDYYFKVYPNGE